MTSKFPPERSSSALEVLPPPGRRVSWPSFIPMRTQCCIVTENLDHSSKNKKSIVFFPQTVISSFPSLFNSPNRLTSFWCFALHETQYFYNHSCLLPRLLPFKAAIFPYAQVGIACFFTFLNNKSHRPGDWILEELRLPFLQT